MQMIEITKADWKLYRLRLPKWQEDYMERLCKEYVELLSSDKHGSEKWWALEKRIKADKKREGVIAELRQSLVPWQLVRLIIDGAITPDDLQGFSSELKDWVIAAYHRNTEDSQSEG